MVYLSLARLAINPLSSFFLSIRSGSRRKPRVFWMKIWRRG
jgi:hypothetical protein